MTTLDAIDLPPRLPPTDAAVPRSQARAAPSRAAATTSRSRTRAREALAVGVDTEDGVRYGLYRGAETIEAAVPSSRRPSRSTGSTAGALRSAPRRSPAGRSRAGSRPSTTRSSTRPAGGRVDRRQTLDHTIGGQRGYGGFSRWWLRSRSARVLPASPTRPRPRSSASSRRGRRGRGRRRRDPCRARRVLDEWALRFAPLDDAALAASATWAGVPVDIDFRLGRWASHITEHTIQLDKTLDWLGYRPPSRRGSSATVRDVGPPGGAHLPVAPAGTEAVASDPRRDARRSVSDASSARAAASA